MKFRPISLIALLCAAAATSACASPGSSSETGLGAAEEALSSNVTGTLTNSQGGAISGATVTIHGFWTATTTTDGNGQYAFLGVAPTSHSVTPSLASCTFSPGSASNVWPGAVVNFTGSGSGCGATNQGASSGASSGSTSSSSSSSGGSTASSSASLPSCPSPGATDDQERAAATVAFNLMQGAAQVGGSTGPVYSNTILASQRYRMQASGTGIEFDPGDPLYPYVSNQMKAALAFAQLDPSVAQFLSDGLNFAYAQSNGWYFPSIDSVSVLANFQYPTTTTVHVADNTSQNNSHQATASGQPWCGTQMVTILDTVQQSYSFSPLYSVEITNPGVSIGGGWLNQAPAAFHGGSPLPTSPFNGPASSGNPYLVVSIDGQATNWAAYNFNPMSCWANPSPFQCTGTIQLDPIPYAEPGAYYDSTGALVGTQSNPFQLASTVLYATPDHASEWATRIVSGVQEWGTFTTPVSLFGVTEYKYVKQM